MYTTFIQNTEGLDASEDLSNLEQANKASFLKKIMAQMKTKVLASMQVSLQEREAIRQETYW